MRRCSVPPHNLTEDFRTADIVAGGPCRVLFFGQSIHVKIADMVDGAAHGLVARSWPVLPLMLFAMALEAAALAVPAAPDASRAAAAGARARAASEAAFARLAASGGPLAPLAEDPAGLEQIAGFFEPALLPTLATLDAVMRERGVHGAVGEIGVFHGRGFVPLALLRRAGERAVAVDVFEQQHLNQDASGAGDEEAFHATLRRFGVTAGVVVLRIDSTALGAEALLEAAGGGVRLLSVDGSHTEAATSSDLQLAAATLVDGGVCLLDDALNPDWPGVASGLVRHLSSVDPLAGHRRLIPFALGYNKCLLTTSEEWARAYGGALAPLGRKRAVLMGHECLILAAGWIAAHFGNDAPVGSGEAAHGGMGASLAGAKGGKPVLSRLDAV